MRSEAQILRNCFHRFYQLGLTTSSGGNISCRTSDGLTCISPSQIDKGFLKAEDFCYLKLNSEIIGTKKPSMEFPFHMAIDSCLAEVSTVLHYHPPVFVALSLLDENDLTLREISDKFKIGYSRYKIPGSEELGEEICRVVENGFEFMLMQNHGMLAVGKNTDELGSRIIALNNHLINFLKLDELNQAYLPESTFCEKNQESNSFYEKRANHFLSIEGGVLFKFDNELEVFYTAVQLGSLKKLGATNFKATIIPESFLLLKNTSLFDEGFNSEKIEQYLKHTESDISIFKNGWIFLKGTSRYHLYDKLEVLDFTAKVILIAQTLGHFNLLTENQINDLVEDFS